LSDKTAALLAADEGIDFFHELFRNHYACALSLHDLVKG
jgi:hypothetical protein